MFIILILGRSNNGRLAITQSNSQQNAAAAEQIKKRKLMEQKLKDRVIIEQINSSVQINQPPESASIEEIVDKLPTPPDTPPATPTPIKSQSMWNLKSSNALSSAISQSHTNLAHNSPFTDSGAQSSSIPKTKSSSRLFRRFFNPKLKQVSPATSLGNNSTSPTILLPPKSTNEKKKMPFFRKKTDIQKL